ncbi:MAG: ABC transporter permease [Phycisphaeraceae bacterium]|nr:MAG: ABC transporter permease [Phycisphaeraceae bacterium]
MTPRIVVASLVVRLRSLGRERSAMFFTVAFPVILVLVFGAIFGKSEHANFDLPVQDLDQTPASAVLMKSLGVDGVFRAIPVPSDVDAGQYTRENKLNLVLVIPRGFAEMQERRIEHGDGQASIELTYIYDPSSTSVTTKLQYLSAIVAASNQRLSGAPAFMTMTEKSILNKKHRFIEFFVPGIIAMAVMTSCLSGTLNTNAELRQKGILRKLATTPITRVDWLVSNILYQFILAGVSTVSILLVAYAVFDVRLHIGGWLPVFVVLAVFSFVGIGMLLTPIAKEAESAVAVANAFLFPMMFLSGTFFPVEMMPGFLQKVARVLPLYYVNEGLRASMIFLDNVNAAKCAAITAGVAAAVFAAGAAVTRWDRDA